MNVLRAFDGACVYIWTHTNTYIKTHILHDLNNYNQNVREKEESKLAIGTENSFSNKSTTNEKGNKSTTISRC